MSFYFFSRLHQVQEKFQSKWDEAVSKFTASDSDTCKGTETKDKRDIVKNPWITKLTGKTKITTF